MKTAKLTGAALDWAVASLEFTKGSFGGEAQHYSGNRNERWIRIPDKENRTWVLARYSTHWEQSGPIIERERISIKAQQPDWTAYIAICDGMTDRVLRGKTPLEAAMRCFVASKLGNEVEIPKELL
jgi:hypothetical protein